jgi:putative ABC transport system permease protein
MLSNYLKIITRNFFKNKSYTLINIVGLSAGMVVFLLIMAYVNYEFSFDQYHENTSRIYRVVQEQKDNYFMGKNQFGVTPAPLGPVLMEEYPEVELATRILKGHNTLIGNGEESFPEPGVYGVDTETFGIFTFEYVRGNPDVFLTEKYTVVISESIARKYFDKEDPIGQTLLYRNKHEFKIVGIVKDMPKNSHFIMNIMFHYESIMELNDSRLDYWNSNSYYTYILLNEKGDPKALEAKFPALRDKYTDDKLDKHGQESRYFLQRFDKIHLYSNINFDIAPSTDVNKLYIYSTVAVLILLIACINYMNLATAQATRRTMEVGIRKVAGARKHQLIIQFLGESFALTILSLLLSIAIILIVMPSFAQFVDLDLSLNIKENPQWVLILLLTCLVVGFISGSYPALRLSSFVPIIVLKGGYNKGTRGYTFRNILVIGQFAISGALIIGAIIVANQLRYIQNTDMGYSRDQTIILRIRDVERKKIPILKEELRKISGVLGVASSMSLPNNISSSTHAKWPGMPKETELQIYSCGIDYDYIDLYDIEIIEGRNFSRELDKGKGAFLINESAAKALKWDNPLEHELIRGDTGRIVGIMKDFHQHSLHLEIKPLQFFLDDSRRTISVKIAASDIQNTIAMIKNTKESFSSKFPFDYEFFDEVFDNAYRSEQKIGKMANWFTGLTILIACLGLYGLASFTTEQRIKEVGIRKVLGASVSKIMYLLSKDFTVLVVISFLISVPIAYFAMDRWLDNFAYHIDFDLITFISTMAIMVAVSWATVGYRTFKAANADPVKSLRDE